MDVLPEKETTYICTLLDSIPAVFERRCSINDMDFILSCLKQTICHRGVSEGTQKLLIHILIPLSSFKVGLMGAQELKDNVMHVIVSLGLQLQLTGAQKLGSVKELKGLAMELCSYSRQQCLKQYIEMGLSAETARGMTPSSESNKSSPKRLVYNRDSLLSLRNFKGTTLECTKIPKFIARTKASSRKYPSSGKENGRNHLPPTKTSSGKKAPASGQQSNRKKKSAKPKPSSLPKSAPSPGGRVSTKPSYPSPYPSPTLTFNGTGTMNFIKDDVSCMRSSFSNSPSGSVYQISDLPSTPPMSSYACIPPNCTSSPITPWECMHGKGLPNQQGSRGVFNFVTGDMM